MIFSFLFIRIPEILHFITKTNTVKKKILKHAVLLILYTLIYLYFAIFNWQVFIVKLNIDLGFAVITIPPFIFLFLIGFIIIGILSWMHYMASLQKMIYELEQGVEFGKMRDRMVKSRVRDWLLEESNVTILTDKLGIRDLRKKQEELMKLLSDINQKVQNQKDN
jgi:hypothetical protein